MHQINHWHRSREFRIVSDFVSMSQGLTMNKPKTGTTMPRIASVYNDQ